MSVLDKLTGALTGETEFERLEKRLENLRRERERLAQKAEEEIQNYATALVEGQPTGVLDPGIERRLRALDAAIAEIERRMRAAEPEHIRVQIARLEAELQRAEAPYREAVAAYEKAETAWKEAQQAFWDAQATHLPRIQSLYRRIEELRERLTALEAGEAPLLEFDEARYREYLTAHRQGRRNVIDHNDPSDVRAYRDYESERDALRQWAVDIEAGADVRLPEAVRRYWPRERVAELLKAWDKKKALQALSWEWKQAA